MCTLSSSLLCTHALHAPAHTSLTPTHTTTPQEEFAQRYLGYNHAAKKQLTAKRAASNALPKPFRYAGVFCVVLMRVRV